MNSLRQLLGTLVVEMINLSCNITGPPRKSEDKEDLLVE